MTDPFGTGSARFTESQERKPKRVRITSDPSAESGGQTLLVTDDLDEVESWIDQHRDDSDQ